jgi:hypothetical protein
MKKVILTLFIDEKKENVKVSAIFEPSINLKKPTKEDKLALYFYDKITNVLK